MEDCEIDINKISKKKIPVTQSIINSQNYIGTFFKDIIDIYELNENLELKLITSYPTNIKIGNIDFNPKHKEIILSTHPNDYIKLWYIPGNNTLEMKSILKGKNSISPDYAKFNPINENLIISSGSKVIDIWDITKYISLNNLSTEKYIFDLKWDLTGNYFGYIHGANEFQINDKDCNKLFKISLDDLLYIEFKNNFELITFHTDQSVKIWDIRNYSIPKIQKTIDKYFYLELYDEKNNYTYILNNLFEIYNSDNFTEIYEKNIKCETNSIILDSCLLKNKEIANLIEQDRMGTINIIQIINNKKIESDIIQNENIEQNINNSNDFINNIIYNISDYTSFSKYINNKKDVDYTTKNYFHMQEIQQDLDALKEQSLPERKKYVEDILSNIKPNFKNIKEEYLFYVRLLIRDNTNTILLKDYLQFLEHNKEELTKIINNLDIYENEVEFYKVCFTKQEYMSNFNLDKIKSEKDNLIEFLTGIKNAKDLNELKDKRKSIKSIIKNPYFNQPITEDNEELLFYKNRILLYYSFYENIDSLDEETFLSQKWLIDKILSKKYFDRGNIIKNRHKFNLLISLILKPESKDSNEYILNILDSNDNNENDINYIKNKCENFLKI